MLRLWRSLAYNYREGGIRGIAAKVAWRLRQPLWSETFWLVYRADPGGMSPEGGLPLARREMEFESLREHGYFKALDYPETTRARLAAGERCHGFFLDGSLVNVAWTAKDRLILETGGLAVGFQNCIGIFDCYTMPAHRGKGIYTASLRELLREARRGGAAAAIAVNPANFPSIRGIERAGFVPLFRMTRRRRFGRESIERSTFARLSADRGS